MGTIEIVEIQVFGDCLPPLKKEQFLPNQKNTFSI